MDTLLNITVIILVIFVVVKLISFAIKQAEKSREKKHRFFDRYRKFLLNSGNKGIATVVASTHIGRCEDFEVREVYEVNVSIINEVTDEQFELTRSLNVPLENVSDMKKGNTIPVWIHPDDKEIILFDFDKDGWAMNITLAKTCTTLTLDSDSYVQT